MEKIHERYINEGCRIRESYLTTIESIQDKEKIINKHKEFIKNLMESASEYVEKNKDKSIDHIKKELNNNLLDIDSSINKITKELEPLGSKMDELKKDSKTLYNIIKEKHPDLSDLDIQEQIFKSIKR